MNTAMLGTLLWLIALPTVCWCGRITPESFPKTAHSDTTVMSMVIASVADLPGESGSSFDERSGLELTWEPNGPPKFGPSTMEKGISVNPGTLLWQDRSINYVPRPAGGKAPASLGLDTRSRDEAGMEIMTPEATAFHWLHFGHGQVDTFTIDLAGFGESVSETVGLCLVGLVAMVPYCVGRRGTVSAARRERRRTAQPALGTL